MRASFVSIYTWVRNTGALGDLVARIDRLATRSGGYRRAGPFLTLASLQYVLVMPIRFRSSLDSPLEEAVMSELVSETDLSGPLD
jgi:hypothetical protein